MAPSFLVASPLSTPKRLQLFYFVNPMAGFSFCCYRSLGHLRFWPQAPGFALSGVSGGSLNPALSLATALPWGKGQDREPKGPAVPLFAIEAYPLWGCFKGS